MAPERRNLVSREDEGRVIELVLVTLAIAFSVPGIVLAVRALPWVARQVDAGVKPWACDVCSCFWITGALALWAAAFRGDPMFLLVAGPAYTLAMLVLSVMQRPTTLPPPPE